LFARY